MHDSTSVQRQDAFYPPEILKEAAAIREARESRNQLWASLGLTVPDDSLTLHIARTHAAVDNCLKRRAENSGERLREIVARFDERAAGAV